MTEFARRNDDPRQEGFGDITTEQIRELPGKNPDQAFIIIIPGRPGTQEWMMEMENTLYTPDTDKNILFEMFLVKWPQDFKMVNFLIAIPLKDIDQVEKMANKHGLHLKHRERPMTFGKDGKPDWFPVPELDNVYSLAGLPRNQ